MASESEIVSSANSFSTVPSSPSPSRRVCCFGGSSKSVKKKKSKGKVKTDDILTDIDMFSLTQQRRSLKKAVKAEEKASREAEKVVEWVKHASARMMDVSAIDDLLTDDDADADAGEKK